jgi:hypothetical protein
MFRRAHRNLCSLPPHRKCRPLLIAIEMLLVQVFSHRAFLHEWRIPAAQLQGDSRVSAVMYLCREGAIACVLHLILRV